MTTITESSTQRLDVPILDLGPYFAGEPGALEKAAMELRYIGENVGFHYIKNHGVPESLIEETFEQARRFHAQPLDEKMTIKVNSGMQGYMPIKASTTRTSNLSTGNKPNLNEAFFIQREPSDESEYTRQLPPNQWPQNLPGFKETVWGYYTAMDALAKRMLPVYAVALDLEPDFFAKAFQAPYCGLRMTHYPPADYVEKEFGIAPHTDSSFLTLLAQNKQAGLQIKLKDDRWVEAPGIAGTIIVNSGDILNRWSNGRFLSTPHRAYNVDRGPRYAIPFFVHPDWNFRMEPLASCVGPDRSVKFGAETTKEYMDWFQKTNYDHLKGKN